MQPERDAKILKSQEQNEKPVFFFSSPFPLWRKATNQVDVKNFSLAFLFFQHIV